MLTWLQQSLRDKPEYPPLFHYPNTKLDSSLQTRPVNTQKWEKLNAPFFMENHIGSRRSNGTKKKTERRKRGKLATKKSKETKEKRRGNKDKKTKVHF